MEPKEIAAKALIDKYGPEQAREMTIGPMREAVDRQLKQAKSIRFKVGVAGTILTVCASLLAIAAPWYPPAWYAAVAAMVIGFAAMAWGTRR